MRAAFSISCDPRPESAGLCFCQVANVACQRREFRINSSHNARVPRYVSVLANWSENLPENAQRAGGNQAGVYRESYRLGITENSAMRNRAALPAVRPGASEIDRRRLEG